MHRKFSTYPLEVSNKIDKEIKIGRLGQIESKKGTCLYVGSTKKGLISRLRRHISKKKKLFWHIDYFLSQEKVSIEKIWLTYLDECFTSKFILRDTEVVKGFGSSDCRYLGHLFYLGKNKVRKSLKEKLKLELIEIPC
ncbi:MAG: GIY-YIG nuclease family protein [Candidatus Omnitrophica bacterium]|nr:GIY-YIG nuclease family protein [Candidatus Omnitrophota bacterium]